MGYDRSSLPAHILAEVGGIRTDWGFEVLDGGKPALGRDWVLRCLSGTLTYPPAGDKCYAVRALEWVESLERCGFDAQDATHVMASGEYYRSGQSNKPVEESNGLLYALTYAPKLSDKYTTGEAREAWGNGEFVGHPIMVMDGKSENTKFVGEVRETMSFLRHWARSPQ